MSNEDLESRVRRGFEQQGLMKTLGVTLVSVAEGSSCLRIPYDPRVTQQHGLFHGGVTATLADNATAFAAYTTMAPDQQPLSVEFKINFLAPAKGEALEARATVLRAGYRLKIAQADIYAIENGQETLVAVALATITATRSVKELDHS